MSNSKSRWGDPSAFGPALAPEYGDLAKQALPFVLMLKQASDGLSSLQEQIPDRKSEVFKGVYELAQAASAAHCEGLNLLADHPFAELKLKEPRVRLKSHEKQILEAVRFALGDDFKAWVSMAEKIHWKAAYAGAWSAAQRLSLQTEEHPPESFDYLDIDTELAGRWMEIGKKKGGASNLSPLPLPPPETNSLEAIFSRALTADQVGKVKEMASAYVGAMLTTRALIKFRPNAEDPDQAIQEISSSIADFLGNIIIREVSEAKQLYEQEHESGSAERSAA